MKRVGFLLVGVFLAASCGGEPAVSASVVSTADTIGIGLQRVLVSLSDGEGESMVLDAPMATLRDENGSPLGTSDGELVWVVPDESSAYAFQFEIPAAETYQLTIDLGELGETRPAGFVAVDDPIQVQVGDVAPPIQAAPVPGQSVVVFASPEWCPAQSCQPMLDQVDARLGEFPGVSLVHVEVFEDVEVVDEADLVLSSDVEAWGLPSQPWLYVVDASGQVAALFEGALSDDELRQALEMVG